MSHLKFDSTVFMFNPDNTYNHSSEGILWFHTFPSIRNKPAVICMARVENMGRAYYCWFISLGVQK